MIKPLVAVLLLASLTAAATAESRNAPSISVTSGVVSPGDPIVVRISGATPGRRLRLYLQRRPAVTAQRIAMGSVIPNRRGRARFRVQLPKLPASVYAPVACCSGGRAIAGSGLLSVTASAPSGFGELGAPGCNPASPRNQAGTGLARFEMFGTAAGAELWVLAGSAAAFLSSDDEAIMDRVLGERVKIIFRLTSGMPSSFHAVAPDGTRVPPVWGPTAHGSSNWERPGSEWGAGFVFTQAGCWRIHAGSWPSQGDIWFLIRS